MMSATSPLPPPSQLQSIINNASIPSTSSEKSSKSIKTSQGFTFSLETPSLSSGTLDKYLKSVLGTESSSAIPELLKQPHQEQASVQAPAPPTTASQHTTVPLPPALPLDGPKALAEAKEAPASSNPPIHPVETTKVSSPDSSEMTGELTTTSESNEVIPIPRGQAYVDITEYLNMPQAEAAKKLGIPPSTLSKRWKEAVRKRKWPYRMICKIDKEIMTLLHNVPQGANAPPLPEEIESALGHLLRKRQEELRPVVIRI